MEFPASFFPANTSRRAGPEFRARQGDTAITCVDWQAFHSWQPNCARSRPAPTKDDHGMSPVETPIAGARPAPADPAGHPRSVAVKDHRPRPRLSFPVSSVDRRPMRSLSPPYGWPRHTRPSSARRTSKRSVRALPCGPTPTSSATLGCDRPGGGQPRPARRRDR
jgi:hypothetical protein